MFIDKATIKVRAGDGGDGAVSFRREKYVAAGGPDGGDGGKGGDVIFEVSDNCSTLSDFRYKRKYIAPNGEPGRGKKCFGKDGADLIIPVPRGTLIYDNATGRLLADMSGKDVVSGAGLDRFVAAKGGRGGWGNAKFATPTRQAPRFAKPGLPGESLELRLELKLLADVGLVGFPNVGKSTLISVVSEAKPEIANYHFTTLTPVLGVVRIGHGTSFVMADIPGIIEGASQGLGLGHDFLRHVERCRILVHVVDVSGSEGRDPLEDFEIINKELAEYGAKYSKFGADLANRPMVVVGNKCDLTDEQTVEQFAAEMKKRGYPFFPMMAAIAHGTDQLVKYLAEQLSKLPPILTYPSDPEPAPEPETTDQEPVIRVVDGVYEVEADWLLPILRTVDMDDYESLQYFQRVLVSSGIIDKLREAGVQEGDIVRLYGFEFGFIN